MLSIFHGKDRNSERSASPRVFPEGQNFYPSSPQARSVRSALFVDKAAPKLQPRPQTSAHTLQQLQASPVLRTWLTAHDSLRSSLAIHIKKTTSKEGETGHKPHLLYSSFKQILITDITAPLRINHPGLFFEPFGIVLKPGSDPFEESRYQ